MNPIVGEVYEGSSNGKTFTKRRVTAVTKEPRGWVIEWEPVGPVFTPHRGIMLAGWRTWVKRKAPDVFSDARGHKP